MLLLTEKEEKEFGTPPEEEINIMVEEFLSLWDIYNHSVNPNVFSTFSYPNCCGYDSNCRVGPHFCRPTLPSGLCPQPKTGERC